MSKAANKGSRTDELSLGGVVVHLDVARVVLILHVLLEWACNPFCRKGIFNFNYRQNYWGKIQPSLFKLYRAQFRRKYGP